MLNCEASFAGSEAAPRFAKARIQLISDGPESQIVVNFTRNVLKLYIRNICKVYRATILFQMPAKQLMIRCPDQAKIADLMNNVKRLMNGEALEKHRLSNGTKDKPRCKPEPTYFNSETNSNLNALRNQNLNRVHISHIPFRRLPSSLYQLPFLTELRLKSCSLSTLPKHLCALGRSLKLLDLSDNSIARIPITFCRSFHKLMHLNLSKNKLKYLPLELASLGQLEELDVTNNQLRTIPITIQRIVKLRVFNISNNHIHLVPICLFEAFKSIPAMARLNLSDNVSHERNVDYKYVIAKVNGEHRLQCNDKLMNIYEQNKLAKDRAGNSNDSECVSFPLLAELATSAVLTSYRNIQALSEHYLPKHLSEPILTTANKCCRCHAPFAGYKYVLDIEDCVLDCHFTVMMHSFERKKAARYLCTRCAYNTMYRN